MPTISGNLKDFGLGAMAQFHPEIVFTPSGPATRPTTLLVTQPIVAIPSAGSGWFSVELVSTANIRPARWYEVAVQWLNSSGGYVRKDYLDWKLFVPPAGGDIGELLAVPTNPVNVYVNETSPLNPAAGTWWLKPSTGDLFEWTGPTPESGYDGYGVGGYGE